MTARSSLVLQDVLFDSATVHTSNKAGPELSEGKELDL